MNRIILKSPKISLKVLEKSPWILNARERFPLNFLGCQGLIKNETHRF